MKGTECPSPGFQWEHLTFEALSCEGQIHSHLSWQAGQEVGRADVCEEADATLWHCKHGPVHNVLYTLIQLCKTVLLHLKCATYTTVWQLTVPKWLNLVLNAQTCIQCVT